MTKTIASFTVLKNTNKVGIVNAVSYAQALARATGRYGRCEVLANGDARMDRKGRHADSYSHGRSPYPTPGFDERRAALIAAHKAGEAL
jgi:hypothetical protein